METEKLFSYFETMLIYKKPVYITGFILAFPTSAIIKKLQGFIHSREAIIEIQALTFLMLMSFVFILGDFITGILASRKEGNPIVSSKWGVTVSKTIGLVLYIAIASFVLLFLSKGYIALVLIYSPMFLNLIKEYISIGENLARLQNGKKSYMFLIIDKTFDIIEKKFFKTIENIELNKNGNIENTGTDDTEAKTDGVSKEP